MRYTGMLVLAALAAAACKDGETTDSAGANGGGPPPMPAEVATARRDTVVDAISATGEIEAVQSIQLRPDVEGRIVSILVREGQRVGAGAPLFKVDDAELKAQVERLEAQKDLADQALRRTKDLLEQNAASTSDLERAEATARSNAADLSLYKVRLERTTVRAPFAGIVGERSVSLGDYVTTGTPLVSLQTVDPIRASFQVPERFARDVATGQQVRFQVAALPGEEFTGTVDFVDPVVQLPGRTILVKARVPNRNGRLQSGMFIEARLATEVRPNAVVVPEEAIVPLQGVNFVWVVEDQKAVRREVVLGVRTPGYVELRSGVEVGEQVVTGGQARLQPGAPVAPIPVDRTPQGGGEPPDSASDTAPRPAADSAGA